MSIEIAESLKKFAEARGIDINGLQVPQTEEERQQLKMNSYNESVGELTGYDCIKCKNRGDFLTYTDGIERFIDCECMEIRNSLKRLENAQINISRYTFDGYRTDTTWRTQIKKFALRYVVDDAGKWFFIGGQNGCGKSHICTAISTELIKQGKQFKYMKWKDEGTKLKALVNEADRYGELIEPYKTADILYIDDFFKTDKRTAPTAGDINVAFEIIDARYNNSLQTIISSERTIGEIMEADKAVGGRIKEMTDGYCLDVPADDRKDYRINKGE